MTTPSFKHKELMRFQMQHRFGLEQRQTKHTFMIERTEHRRNHLGIDKPWKLWKYLQGSETRTNFMSIISRSMQFAKIQLPLHSDIWWFLVLWLSFRVFVYVPGSLCSSLFKSVQVCSSLFKSVQVCSSLSCVSLPVLAAISSCLPPGGCLSKLSMCSLRSRCYWFPGSVFPSPSLDSPKFKPPTCAIIQCVSY